MRKMFFVSIILLLCFASECRAKTSNPIEMLQKLLDSIVTVRGQTFDLANSPSTEIGIDPRTGAIITRNSRRLNYYEKNGAGVIISTDGRIVTNTHVIFGSQHIRITLRDGTEHWARVLYISREDDFSIIQIDAGRPLLPVEFVDTQTIALGDEVSTIGHSDLLNGTFSGGVIAGIGTREKENGTEVDLLKLNINHYSGDSGGPVFDRSGRLVGLISAKGLRTDRQLIAIPAYKIHFADINLDKASQNQ